MVNNVQIFPEVDKGTVTREDWDNLYADYTATLDFPGAMFPRKIAHSAPSLAHLTHKTNRRGALGSVSKRQIHIDSSGPRQVEN